MDSPSFNVSLQEGSGRKHGTATGVGDRGKLVDFEIHLSEATSGIAIDRQIAHTKVINRLHALGSIESTTGQRDVVYAYSDEDGEIISETVRVGGDKRNMIRRRPHPDKPGKYIANVKGCRPLLYRLPEIREANTVIVCEGEPDAEAVLSLRLKDDSGLWIAATTAPNGGGVWKAEYTQQLRGKTVILIPHNDASGKGLQYMKGVQEILEGQGIRTILCKLPDGINDADDYLKEHTDLDFIALVGQEKRLLRGGRWNLANLCSKQSLFCCEQSAPPVTHSL